tara:strand:- start:27688 stop:28494 length:807 start_codon:yes stop_codon:yes gene_type:complete
MFVLLRPALLSLLLAIVPVAGHAAEPLTCTLIADVESGAVLVRDGTCDQRVAPFSTFKLPLAVMGFETGILKDSHTPSWHWQPGIAAPERDRKSVDPTIWERDSVLWYSRELVQRMGAETFGALVARIDYGNRDVAGTAGKDNGMTHAWLGASLTISPEEQVQFVRGLVLGQLPVSAGAQAGARAALPSFPAGDGWVLTGKTGSGWVTDAQGNYAKDRSLGWFIGWAERGDDRVAFARLLVDNRARGGALGLTMRDSLITDWPALVQR